MSALLIRRVFFASAPGTPFMSSKGVRAGVNELRKYYDSERRNYRGFSKYVYA